MLPVETITFFREVLVTYLQCKLHRVVYKRFARFKAEQQGKRHIACVAKQTRVTLLS